MRLWIILTVCQKKKIILTCGYNTYGCHNLATVEFSFPLFFLGVWNLFAYVSFSWAILDCTMFLLYHGMWSNLVRWFPFREFFIVKLVLTATNRQVCSNPKKKKFFSPLPTPRPLSSSTQHHIHTQTKTNYHGFRFDRFIRIWGLQVDRFPKSEFAGFFFFSGVEFAGILFPGTGLLGSLYNCISGFGRRRRGRDRRVDFVSFSPKDVWLKRVNPPWKGGDLEKLPGACRIRGGCSDLCNC